nr:MAG TPA: tail connector protein [Caudoviricetes sp.]
MSNTTNPLIDVDFVDNTNYANPLSTDDVVGGVVETVWGKVDQMVLLDSVSWEAFANPLGLARVNQSYATIRRLFDAGAKYIEVYRPSKNEKYLFVTGVANDSGDTPTLTVTAIDKTPTEAESYEETFWSNEKAVFCIRYRYPGGFPGKLEVIPFTGRKPDELANVALFNINLYLNGAQDPTETFTVSFTQAEASGESFFYAEILNNQSQYLTAKLDFVAEGLDEALLAVKANADVDYNEMFTGEGGIWNPNPLTIQDYINAYEKFRDRTRSSSTLLISTFNPNDKESADEIVNLYGKLCEVSNARKDMNALVGCRKQEFNGTDEGDRKQAIQAYIDSIPNQGMFNAAYAAVERVVVRNKAFLLDGTATAAGAIASVAASLKNRNRLPSYMETGKVNAVLMKSLEFNTVVELMDESGIGSIYTAASGNYLFNIRSRYSIQRSYFGKLNVMRVTAALLAWLMTDAEYAIHTEVTSDEAQRIAFQERCNSKLGQMIARGELKSESYISAGNDINTDALTNGGECLNLEAYCWFKKLTERVKIKVIATDTTTSVSISQE